MSWSMRKMKKKIKLRKMMVWIEEMGWEVGIVKRGVYVPIREG